MNFPREERHSQHLHLSKPYIVGYMSVDQNREYHSDLTQLKFLTSIPRGKIALDLNHNINKAVKRTTDDNDEKIDLLLKFLVDQNKRLFSEGDDWMIITYRRTLISVMCAALGSGESVRVVASLFDGLIYLCSVETPQQVQRRKARTKQEEKFCAWGYKFEQYLLSDQPHLQPNIEKPVVENEEFSIYYSAVLGQHKLLYGAQIDGLLATDGKSVMPNSTASVEENLNYLKNNTFVELKTNRIIQNRRQEDNLKKHKLLRCWCQCYLAGLEGLLVGYRSDGGIVQGVEWFSTLDIVRYCRSHWHPGPAINFLDYFLTFIKQCFRHRISETKGDNCNLKEIDVISLQFDIDVNNAINVSQASDVILPEWYLEAKKSYMK